MVKNPAVSVSVVSVYGYISVVALFPTGAPKLTAPRFVGAGAAIARTPRAKIVCASCFS